MTPDQRCEISRLFYTMRAVATASGERAEFGSDVGAEELLQDLAALEALIGRARRAVMAARPAGRPRT